MPNQISIPPFRSQSGFIAIQAKSKFLAASQQFKEAGIWHARQRANEDGPFIARPRFRLLPSDYRPSFNFSGLTSFAFLSITMRVSGFMTFR